jgi:hypothetical protein
MQYFCALCFRRGARVVMEQIANLSTGNRRQGSSPCLSAIVIPITFEINVLGIFYFLIVRYLYGIPILKAKTSQALLIQE